MNDTPSEYPYIFRWSRPGLPGRKGQPCKVLRRGKKNSCLIQFQDGHGAIVSRNALGKSPVLTGAKKKRPGAA